MKISLRPWLWGLSVLVLCFLPRLAFADTADQNCGGIPDPGKKFVKFYVTENPRVGPGPQYTPYQGGELICITVSKDKTSLTYAEMKAFEGGPFQSMGVADNTRIERAPLPGLGGVAGESPANRTNFPFSDEICVGVGKCRYIIHSGRTFYMYYRGEQAPTKDEAAALISCRQELYTAIPGCQSSDFDNIKSVEQAKEIFGDKLTQCRELFEKCVRKLTGLSSDPNADSGSNPYKNDPRFKTPDNYQGPLPPCSFTYEGCRNIDDLLQLFINLGKNLFQVIGTFAFIMFIYGGFTLVMSMGSPEKVKKGQEVLVAAVVGIIISFGAYLIINFVLDALQVSDNFRAVGVSIPEAKK